MKTLNMPSALSAALTGLALAAITFQVSFAAPMPRANLKTPRQWKPLLLRPPRQPPNRSESAENRHLRCTRRTREATRSG